MILDRSTGDQRHDHWDDAPLARTLHSQHSNVTAEERAARFGQNRRTVLLTGLTGVRQDHASPTPWNAACSTRAGPASCSTARTCGSGISRDLGFTAEDRSENLRRSAEVAKLMNDAGLICIAAFVAPSEEVRQRAAQVIGAERFLVVHLTPPSTSAANATSAGSTPKRTPARSPTFPASRRPTNRPWRPTWFCPRTN